MNSPTNIEWVMVPNCTCPDIDSVCIRPSIYSKPILCSAYGTKIDQRLTPSYDPFLNSELALLILGVLLLVAMFQVFPPPLLPPPLVFPKTSPPP